MASYVKNRNTPKAKTPAAHLSPQGFISGGDRTRTTQKGAQNLVHILAIPL